MLKSGHLYKYKCEIIMGKLKWFNMDALTKSQVKITLDCVILLSTFMEEALDKDLHSSL